MRRLLVLAMVTAAILVLAPGAPAQADSNEAPGAPEAFRSITVAWFHTCALRYDGAVRCWGNGANIGLGDTNTRGDGPGEMGDNLPTVDLGTGRTAAAITGGNGHTCALLDNSHVKCWGANDYGQLGRGDLATRGDGPGEMGDNLPTVALGNGRTATAITAGSAHTCALLDNGQVKCWGYGARLGVGDTADRGDGPGEMGDALVPAALGANRIAITAGDGHTCALLDDQSVKCWGSNGAGQLGLGGTTSRGDGPGEMGDNLPAVALGTGQTATAVTGGGSYTCALLDDGQAKCWGTNGAGQLGLGGTDTRGDGAGEMGDNLPTVALGNGRTATAITAGDAQTCALLDNDHVKCWGGNGFGNLGLGDTGDRGDQPGEMGDNLPSVDLPPPNDGFAGAQVLAGPIGSVRGSNANADKQAGETDHDGFAAADSSVWYRWTAPVSGPVIIDTLGSTFDTVLAVYTGTTVNALTAVASNDDAAGLQSQVEYTATVGTTYRIAVAGFNGGSGHVLLHWLQAPANNDFAAATTLTGTTGTSPGNNVGADLEAGEPDHNPTANGAIASIWYRWTAPAGGRTAFDTFSSTFDTVLAVYTGTTVDHLTPVGANDDGQHVLQSQVVFTAAAGTTYRIALAAFDTLPAPSGPATLNWRQSAPCDGRPVTRDLSMGDTPSAGADVIRGTNANDTIDGRGGADRICGGNGTDTLRGGTGAAADRLFGEGGTDTLRGGAGNDAINGGGQNDRLFGEAGKDTLNGGAQRDTCNGGTQRDTQTGCEVRSSIP
jgi:alpha-tubulin suppressor-like RCC1 family protein